MKLSFLLTVILATHAASQCTRHEQCGPASASNFCTLGMCIPVSRPDPPLTLRDVARRVDAAPISLSDRRHIMRSAAKLIADLNPNTQLYRTIHKVRPSKMLYRLARREKENGSTYEFHETMKKAFNRLNDIHSIYQPPRPLNETAATLGFSLAAYYKAPDSPPSFIVSEIVPGFSFGSSFTPGVVVTSIDGVPILDAVLKIGRGTFAANDAARLAWGVEALPNRILQLQEAPRNTSVHVEYLTHGIRRTKQIPWTLLSIRTDDMSTGENMTASVRGLHSLRNSLSIVHPLERMPLARANRAMFSSSGRESVDVNPPFNLLFAAYIHHTKTGRVGVLHLPSFGTPPSEELSAELSRVIGLLPTDGLVVDVRGNLGGSPGYAILVTELISSTDVGILPITLRASKMMKKFSEVVFSKTPTFRIEEILMAVRDAYAIGDRFTGPTGDISAPATGIRWPRVARVYFGPVVTLTDARTLSAGDIFTLLQRDLGASYVVGVDNTTAGAGAAGVPYSLFQQQIPEIVGRKFPPGVDFTTAWFRFYRTGNRSGGIVEHFGVEPDERYFITKRDIIEEDSDLMNFLGDKLASMGRM